MQCKQWYHHWRRWPDAVPPYRTHSSPSKQYHATSAAYATLSRSKFNWISHTPALVYCRVFAASTNNSGNKRRFSISSLVLLDNLGGHRGACPKLLSLHFVLGFSTIFFTRMHAACIFLINYCLSSFIVSICS